MTLVVRTPLGYRRERRYILDVVLSDWLGLDWRLVQEEGRAEVRITTDGPEEGFVALPDGLFATDRRQWLTAASMPREPLRRVPVEAPGLALPLDPLPVVYGTETASTAASYGEGGARLSVDVFGSAFFMLTRYEEAVLPDRDPYDRFPAVASVAGRGGFLTSAVVDAYVELLWAALSRVWPGLRRRRRTYAVLLTHDVDDPLATLGRTGADLVRQWANDLVGRRDPALARRRVGAVLAARRGDHRQDPNNTFDFLMDVSERHGLRSGFYFQAHERMRRDIGALYPLRHPFVQELLRRVHGRGHEIGYHAGFGTYRDAARTTVEFDHLRAVTAGLGIDVGSWGGRQHYLQWDVAHTWRNWSSAGLQYDATVGYAEAVGFRTGTCHEFQVFDLTAAQPLDLRERPFQVMDGTLFGYMSLGPAAAADAVLGIARECRRYGGSLGILWHNNTHLRASREKSWYRDLVAAVTAAP
jgi:hypothetical protein